MTTAVMRARLYDIISIVDDKKIEAIYTLLEDQISKSYDWSADAEFIAELDERMARYQNGTDKAYTLDEVKDSLNNLKKARAAKLDR